MQIDCLASLCVCVCVGMFLYLGDDQIQCTHKDRNIGIVEVFGWATVLLVNSKNLFVIGSKIR